MEWFVCLQCGDLCTDGEGDVEIELCYACLEEDFWGEGVGDV